MQTRSLPVDEKIPEILAALRINSNLVVSAAPGAGKTTRIPPHLLSLTNKQIIVLEPRRMAAVAAAHRIAIENQWKVGEEVGYQVRFERVCGKNTKLLFMTEALLNKKIISDPSLEEVGAVVLDEFHERSIHLDLALGLLREIQLLARPDLKIIVMSATLDAQGISRYLSGAPIIEVPGRSFELGVQKSKQAQILRTDSQFIERVVDSIVQAVKLRPKGKDILIFLPGNSEIQRVQNRLESWAADLNLLVLPLTGSLNLSDQMKALQPAQRRKIILSTNVAESSVTIDGVDLVIDSGLARVLKANSRTGFEQIVITRISKASAKQRAGRASRQWPGECVQLWTHQDELSMPEFEVAEVHRVDLTESVLFLKCWGIRNIADFMWFDAPSPSSVSSCESWLTKIGALSEGMVTEHGRRLGQIPLHPRLAEILLISDEMGLGGLGCDLASLLQERDLRIVKQSHHENDLENRLEWLEEFRSGRQGAGSSDVRRSLSVIDKSATQLTSFVKTKSREPLDKGKNLSEVIGEILLLALPDRLCRRRALGRSQALMVGKRGVELSEDTSVKKSEFFIALDIMDTDNSRDSKVARAVGITRALLERHFKKYFTQQVEITYDETEKKYFKLEFLSLWDLSLEEGRRKSLSPDEYNLILPELCLREWDFLLRENEALNHWFRRWAYSEAQLNRTETFWQEAKKKEALIMACMGETSLQGLVKKDLVYFFEQVLAGESSELRVFHQQLPEFITAPTGNRFRIFYHINQAPHVEIRLQELFGMAASPRVGKSLMPITIHLLGPNYRPVQVTSDLSSFWRNIYPEVRREMRIQYPKHSWPEDPLTAVPVAKGRSVRTKK